MAELFNQSHLELPFVDRDGGSANLQLGSLVKAVADGKSMLQALRATFIELVLVLAFEQREKDAEKGLKMIRDQFTAIAGNKDGVTESDIHPVLYLEANRALQ